MVEQRQTAMAANRMPIAARTPQAVVATALAPKDIILILRRHIWLIICFTILGLIFGATAWYLMLTFAPKYTATTYIRVLPPIEKDPTRIGGAVQVNKDIQYGHRMSLAALIKQQSTLQELVGRDKIQETTWFRNFAKNKDKRIRKAVKKLKKKFGASAQRDGEFIVVSMTCGNKTEAALIVNEMVRLFISKQGTAKKEEVTAKLGGLRNQLGSVQKELTFADKLLDEIRETTKFTDLEQRNFQTAIEQKLARLELDMGDIEQETSQMRTSIVILQRQVRSPIDALAETEIERDPTIIMFTQRIALQEAELTGMLTKFGGKHPAIQRRRKTIDDLKAQKTERKIVVAAQRRQANLSGAQNTLTIMQTKLDTLETLRQKTAARKADLDQARVLYARRSIARKEIKSRLDALTRAVETRTLLHDDPETPKVQRMGLAPEPLEISSPQWKVYFPAGFILGMMCGIGLAFLIELLNDLVRTPRDVNRYLQIPLLGVVPDANEDDSLSDIELIHVVRMAPYSIVSEAYRRFRTNLKHSALEASSKSILIASGMAEDGRTSVAVNLATCYVAENKKVLLIDANFWRPNLHRLFPKSENGDQPGSNSEFGLSTLLTGLCGYNEVIRSTTIDGLDVIDAGLLPSNPAELIGGTMMEKLIKQQSQKYDYVIIDGPPVLLVSDVKSLARFVDGTVLVLNATATRRGLAMRTIREFREVRANIFGCILIRVKAMKGGYFSEQFKSYQKYQQAQLAHAI